MEHGNPIYIPGYNILLFFMIDCVVYLSQPDPMSVGIYFAFCFFTSEQNSNHYPVTCVLYC